MKIRIELTFPAELKDEPIIGNLCKKFDVTVNILEASFSTTTGWAILIIEGSAEEVKRSSAYFKNKGVLLEDTREIA